MTQLVFNVLDHTRISIANGVQSHCSWLATRPFGAPGRTDEVRVRRVGIHPRTARDRDGRATTLTYDAQHRLVSVLDPMNRETEMGWCGCGSMETLTDARGKTTTWTRDLQGRLTHKTLNDGTTTEWQYDVAGRLQKTLDAKVGADGVNKQATNFEYFLDGSLKKIDYTNELVPRRMSASPTTPRRVCRR